MSTLVFPSLVLVFVSACGGSSDLIGFGATGTPLTIDQIVNVDDSLGKATTDDFYYGRVLIDGSPPMVGSFRLQLVQHDDETAYFSSFEILSLASVTGLESSTPIAACADQNLVDSASYGSGTNTVNVTDATDRFVGFTLEVATSGSCAALNGATVHGGLLVSADGTALVGGDNVSFLFVAERAPSLSPKDNDSADGSWNALTFGVSNNGGISLGDVGSADIAYPDLSSDLGPSFTLGFPDSSSGGFVMSEGGGTFDGGFLISASGEYAVGAVVGQSYFAAWR